MCGRRHRRVGQRAMVRVRVWVIRVGVLCNGKSKSIPPNFRGNFGRGTAGSHKKQPRGGFRLSALSHYTWLSTSEKADEKSRSFGTASGFSGGKSRS